MLDAVLYWAIALCLALLWSSSAWDKLQAPVHFSASLAAYKLIPASLHGPVSRCLPWFEIAIATGLLVPACQRLAASAGALLLLLYAAAMGLNLLRGRADIDCGCNPGHYQRISWLLVARNLLLCTLSLGLLLPSVNRVPEWGDAALVLLASGFGCTVYLFTMSVMLERDSSHHTVD